MGTHNTVHITSCFTVNILLHYQDSASPQDKHYTCRLRTVFCRSPPGPGLVSEAGSLSLSGRRTFQLQHQRRAVLHHARHQQRLRPTQRGEPTHRGVPAGGPVHAAERPGPVLLQPDRDEEGRQRQRSRHQVWAWPLTSLCFFYLTNAEQQSSSSSSPSSPSCMFSEAFLCFHCF